MTDQTGRLRRMADYSWHVLRADSERDRAALADDVTVGRLHDELAELHLLAADDLSEAWRDFSAGGAEGENESHWRAYGALFAALYGPQKLEEVPALMPPALLD